MNDEYNNHDMSAPATKEDLQHLLTKDEFNRELENLATKEDLQHLLSKDEFYRELKNLATKEFVKDEIGSVRGEIKELRNDIPGMIEAYGTKVLVPEIQQAVKDGLEPYTHLLAKSSDVQVEAKVTSELEKASLVASNKRNIDEIISWAKKAAGKIGIEFRHTE